MTNPGLRFWCSILENAWKRHVYPVIGYFPELAATPIHSGNIMFSQVAVASCVFALLTSTVSPAADNQEIVVNLKDQKLYAYEGKFQKYSFHCVTGAKETPTMPGDFTIFRKEKDYRSKKYDAEMPYSMFFSKDGKAVHAGLCCVVPESFVKSMFDDLGADRLGSHGCVRLSKEDAETLFKWAKSGTKVRIVKE
jgi:lipoprotein-anchoring transpeptidase ErfK/SrfK